MTSLLPERVAEALDPPASRAALVAVAGGGTAALIALAPTLSAFQIEAAIVVLLAWLVGLASAATG